VSTTLDTYLRTRRATVDRALAAWLPAPPACPARLADAMAYSTMAGGKRLRPMLALAAAEAVQPDAALAERLALPVACALEYIHTYSLIHDDLPAMDDDSLRRGRPTSHVVFGESTAILAGDALLTHAFVLLAREPVDGPPDLATRKLRAIQVVAEAAGAAGMVGGQALDLAATATGAAATGPGPEAAHAALREIHAAKTGALIRASALAGAIMAGATDAQLSALDRYASRLGLAFQIVDDVLDEEGAAEALGKSVGKDRAAGKLTYPALFGLAESRRLAAAAVDEACEALRAARLDGRLASLARFVLDRSS
jgi:geranylgeranyl diphosphate synthase type II